MKKLPSWLRWVCGGLIVFVGLILLVLVVTYWEWFATEPCGMESRSTTARNVGILFFGLIAIGFGIWRGVVADRQAKASQQQAEISRRSLLHNHYQEGTGKLHSKDLAVRLAGIHELQDLAKDEPEQYHVKTMRPLCTFVRQPTKDPKIKAYPPVREDVQAAMTAIGDRSVGDIKLERDEKFEPKLAGAKLAGANLAGASLAGANLTGASLAGANLTGAHLTGANLTGAHLTDVNLTGAHLLSAHLAGAHLAGAHLAGANLTGANLDGTNFSGAKSLTQDQLDQARADPDKPPTLDGLSSPRRQPFILTRLMRWLSWI